MSSTTSDSPEELLEHPLYEDEEIIADGGHELECAPDLELERYEMEQFLSNIIDDQKPKESADSIDASQDSLVLDEPTIACSRQRAAIERYIEPTIDCSSMEPAIEMYEETHSQHSHVDSEPEVYTKKDHAIEEKFLPTVEYERDEFPCQVVEEGPLMDAIDSGEIEDDRLTMQDRLEFERSMDDALANGDFDEITGFVTPYNLTRCKTNSLEKSLEVSYKLKFLAKRSGPDAEDFGRLANTVENFALELIEPLKNDDMKRAIFEGENFDRIAEKTVLFEQKKFVSHPVVYNLLMRRWTGSFYQHRYNSAITWDWFKWILLNLWTIFDLVLFPLVFVLLYLVHKAIGVVKSRQDHCVTMVLNATWKEGYKEKMRVLANDIIDHCDIKRIKYASIIRLKDGIVTNSPMDKVRAKAEINKKTVSMTTDNNTLKSCLKNGKEMLKRCKGRKSNKTLVIMTDDKFGGSFRSCLREICRVKSLGHRVMCVGLGVHPDIKELQSMATDGHFFLYYGEIKQEDVRKKFLEGVHGNDIFDRYVQYFNTPYFIFVRDTLSYLALLGLHCAMCLQPSTIEFSSFEWIILFFFIGRLLMEIYQAVMEKHLQNKIRKFSSKSKKPLQIDEQDRAPLVDENSIESDQEMVEVKIVRITKQRGRAMSQALFSMISRYFSDWWNALDLITLLVYIVILILRSITWAEHFTIPNNRLLAVAGYFYGLNTMFLTLRVFGHIMESKKRTGSIQIALFQIIGAVLAIFGQFIAAVLAFSLAITKIYVAEMSYSGGKHNSTSHGICESGKSGAACWWRSITHLIWSLLGIAELDPLQSPDEASDVLAKLLYGSFLIMAVVMMMNMMIALLSNTYQQVEDNAFYEWSHRKATTIRTYINYHPVPVPFNIISLACMVIWRIYQRLCCGRRCQNPRSKNFQIKKQEEQAEKNSRSGQIGNISIEMDVIPKKTNTNEKLDSFFDCLVFDLQADYFAGHGYAFPMEESNKIDLLLKETEGSHQLMGQITDQVYKYTANETTTVQKKIGNRSYIWDTSGVNIKGHQLTYAPCTCLDCAWKTPEELPRHHGAQFQVPLDKDWPGFEVLIQDIGDRHFIAVGVVSDGHNAHHFPGWEGNTAGYHVDDGRIYDRNHSKLGRECEGAMAKRGDLIGCKILFDEQSDRGILPVSISLNGRLIGQAKVKGKSEMDGEWKVNDFYPFIGIGWEGVTLLFKLVPCDQQSHFLKKNDSEADLVKTVQQGMSELRAQISGLQNQVQELMSDVSLIKDKIKIE